MIIDYGRLLAEYERGLLAPVRETVIERYAASHPETMLGFPVVIDPLLPPGVVEFRQPPTAVDAPKVLARIENVGTEDR